MRHYKWIRLWADVLEDRKTASLPDRLWRRLVELQLLSAEQAWAQPDLDGYLPMPFELAWRLRLPVMEVVEDLRELTERGLLKVHPGGECPPFTIELFSETSSWADMLDLDWENHGWYIPGFAKTQKKSWVTLESKLRTRIMKRDGYRCRYCGKLAEHVDHVVPRCQGGTDEPTNLVAACKRCNLSKGGRTPEQAGMVLNA